MARFVAGLVLGLALGTGIVVTRASDEVVEAAALEAGVDPQDLAGAVNSTGLEPRDYLIAVGEVRGHERTPAPAPPAPAASPPPSVWTRLAQCESTGRWGVATGNGYYGGLQMDMTFWRRHGGLAYAPRPDLASPTAQIAVAQRGLAVQGPGAWPVCGPRVGLHR